LWEGSPVLLLAAANGEKIGHNPSLRVDKLSVRVLGIKVRGVDGESGGIAIDYGCVHRARRDKHHVARLGGIDFVPQLKLPLTLQGVNRLVMLMMNVGDIGGRSLDDVNGRMGSFYQIGPLDRLVA